MLTAVSETKILLPESEIPTRWYNIASDMPNRPQPVLHPGTGEPVGPDDLAPLSPMGLIAQEVSTDQWIDIPGEVLDILRLWRPTPLVRAERLEAQGDPWAGMNEGPQSIEPLLELHERDRAAGLMDAPWPPVYPKQPDEPPRVAPSRARKEAD